jgi:solute carrier family 25 carnitine/acylcarnitine transporter 20/29
MRADAASAERGARSGEGVHRHDASRPAVAGYASDLDLFLAGGFGGFCLTLVQSPFDVIKMRLQLSRQPEAVPLNAPQVIRNIVRAEGLRGFWRGITPPLVTAMPLYAVVMGSYDGFRHGVQQLSGRPRGDLRDTAVAGALVALPTTFLYTPIDRVKIALQADGRRLSAGLPAEYRSVIDAVQKLWRSGGLTSLYRGFWITLARDVPAWSIYFVTFSAAKRVLSSSDAVLDGSVPLSPGASLVAGGLAGAATWAVGMPMDTIKTAFQTNDSASYRTTFRAIIHASGWRGLYAGFITSVVGGLTGDAACFTGTEALQRLLTMARQ